MSTFWDRVASLPGLSPVIDYRSRETPRARFIHRLHLRALEKVVRPRRSDRFLDYGCGVGRIAGWLAPQVREVVALDPSPAMIAEARRRWQLSNLSFRVAERAPAELPALSVDGVLCIWVLQHILDDRDLDATLDYLATVLRPGGSLFTLDRLCRDPVAERGEYLCIRQRDAYLEAFARRGLELRSCRAVSVGEQVLGSTWLTSWVSRHLFAQGPLAAMDLHWAGRQREPFLADTLCHFQRTD